MADITMPNYEGNEVVIEAGKTESLYWQDVWRYRELLFFLAWRDVLVRYKQTVIGVAWSVVRPLLTILIFATIARLAKLPSEGDVPYPLLICAAMLPWQLFANAFSEASTSLLNNSNLVAKVYFPRVIVPLSTMAVCLVDFLVSLAILFGMMLFYGLMPTWRIVLFPIFVVLSLLAAAGAGIGTAALNVRFRDFRFIVPFIVQLGMYISPVMFSSKLVPAQYRAIYALNPMVGVIDGFRWSVLGQDVSFEPVSFLLSLAIIGCLSVVGTWYFRKTEVTMADRL